MQIQKYISKLSGPLLDRIDMHIEVPSVDYDQLHSRAKGLSSSQMRDDVMRARAVQEKRFNGTPTVFNARMTEKEMRAYCCLDGDGDALLKSAMKELGLSARAYSRVLKLGRTIADLAGHDTIQAEDIAEAVQYRSLDRLGLL
jgi:magnesium chelatase family protein